MPVLAQLEPSLEFDALERCRQWSTTPDDGPIISRLLSQSRTSIAELDAEIAELVPEEKLHTLCTQREGLDALCKRCSSLLAPIRTLPEDVLQEIFLHCDLKFTLFVAYTWGACTSESYGERKSTTYTLAQVCSHWRQIIFLTPSSWSSIVAFWASGSCEPEPQGVAAFSSLYQFLELSKQHPLRIHMEFRKEILDSMGLTGPPAVNAIKAESHRWEDMVFKARNISQLLEIYQWKELQGSLPYLKHISLCGSYLDFKIGPPETPILSNTPRLKSVTLVHVDPRNFPQLPWRQLTSVSLQGDFHFYLMDVITFVLQNATTLQSLSLGTMDLDSKKTPFYEYFYEKLSTETLIQYLQVDNPMVFMELAGSSFPHLTDLSIWNVDLLSQDHIFSFLSTIPQNITSLTLASHSPEIGTDAWAWLWDCAPRKINFLTIESSWDGNEFPSVEILKLGRLARYLHSSGASKFHRQYQWRSEEITDILLRYTEMLETYVQLHQAESNDHQKKSYPNHRPCLKEFAFILVSLQLQDVGEDVAARLQRVSSSCGMRIELRNLKSRVFLVWNELADAS